MCTTFRNLFFVLGICCLVFWLSACGQGSTSSAPIPTQHATTPVQTPTTAVASPQPTMVNPAYPLVDGISCDQLEQTAFHIHVHMSVYVNGQAVAIPRDIGIASDRSCFYWLHTHDSSGVIHIEAPAGYMFTLRNFLDVWKNRFAQLGYPSQLDLPSSNWQVYMNGHPFSGDLHTIPLQPHGLITLAYHSPGVQPDTTYNWGYL